MTVARLAQLRSCLSQDELDVLAQIRRLHPTRTSSCRALLSEIGSNPGSTELRFMAARLHGSMSCKRGMYTLRRQVLLAYSACCQNGLGRDEFPVGTERYMLGALLYAIARIDRKCSHSLLKQCFWHFTNSYLRADVLEAMAFEDRVADIEFVLGILDRETDRAIIESGLYALKVLPKRQPLGDMCRATLVSLLAHESESIRAEAVRVLASDSEFKSVARSLAHDPSPEVREALADARFQNELSADVLR